MRRLFLLVSALLLAALALAACGEKKETPAPPPVQATATVNPALVSSPTPRPTATPAPIPQADTNPRTAAQFRAVQASPDLPPVDMYLDGGNIGRSLAFGQFNNPTLTYAAGEYTLRVYPGGVRPGEQEPLVEQPIKLAAGESTLALVSGTADALQVIIFEEDLSPLPRSTARVNVIHAVPRGDVFNFEEGGQVLAKQLDYGMRSDPLQLAAGDHSFEFRSGPVALGSIDLSLMEYSNYTLLLIGNAGEDKYKVLNLRSRVNSESPVRVVHASPDAPNVDVYLDDLLVADDLAYRDQSGWENLRSFAYNLRVLPHGDSAAPPLLEKQITLKPNQPVDFVILNAAEHLRVTEVDDDLSPTPTNGARFTFVNAAVGTTEVAIETFGGSLPGLSPVGFGLGSNPILQNAGTAALNFHTTDKDDPRQIDFLSERDWSAGHAYTIVITGYPNTEPLVLDTEVGTDQTYIGDTGVVALEQAQAAPAFELRLINALPNARAISLDADGVTIFRDVQSTTTTTYHDFDAPPTRIVVHDALSGSVLLDEPVNWGGAPQITLFVFEDQSAVRYELSPDSQFDIGHSVARLRVMHLSPVKPTLQVMGLNISTPATPMPSEAGGEPSAASPTPVTLIPLADPAQYGQPTNPYEFPAGTYTVQILEHDSSLLVLTVPEMTFEPDTAYDLLLLPDASGLSLNPVLIGHGGP
jgi:hypothetical protein